MCGIVGYVGRQQAAPILLDGLSKLEYRGYDSAGMAIYDGEQINIKKAKGRLKVLDELTHGGETMPEPSESDIHAGQPTENRLTPMHILILTRISPLLWFITESLKITLS